MAKEAKKVKCKKCKLTYDKKKYECPYCHKKRFNPTGLIVFLILLVVAAAVLFYFKGNEIVDTMQETKNVTTFKHDNITYTLKDITSKSIANEIKLEFIIEAENKTDSKYKFDCTLSIYEDEYLNKNWYSGNSLVPSRISDTLQPNTKLEKDIRITLDTDWKEIIIYGEFDGETIEMFRINNTETITQVK